MGLMDGLFGTNGTINEGMNKIDEAFYTDQEKAEMKKELLNDFRPFKLIQRGLAFSVSKLFGFVLIVEVLLVIVGAWYPFLLETAMQINSLEIVGMLGWSFMAVMSLYFTGGVMSSFIKK